MALEKNDFKFEITEEIAVLGINPSGWKKEINMVSWSDSAPKVDIRDWDPDHRKCGRGVTLNLAETEELYRVLTERFDK